MPLPPYGGERAHHSNPSLILSYTYPSLPGSFNGHSRSRNFPSGMYVSQASL